MKEISIYLCGGMEKFGAEHYEKSNDWREYCCDILNNSECEYKANVINPNRYFNFLDNPKRYKTSREVMEFDLNKVRNSDLIIVNFNDKYSLGSMAELAIAYDRRIPIIGLNKEDQELHSWQIEMCTRIFPNVDELLDYVEDFYLT